MCERNKNRDSPCRATNMSAMPNADQYDPLTVLSHELRTPLTSIRALASILLANPDLDRDRRQRFLSAIVQESERLAGVVTNIIQTAERQEAAGHAVAPCLCQLSAATGMQSDDA